MTALNAAFVSLGVFLGVGLAEWLRGRGAPVASLPSRLAPRRPGRAVAPLATPGMGVRVTVSGQRVTLPVPASDPTRPRRDTVVLDLARGSVRIIPGTPSVSPTAPAADRNQRVLAVLDVPAGTTAIVSGMIQ